MKISIKSLYLIAALIISSILAKGQVTTLAGQYKNVDIGWNGVGDYTRSLILLHEMYDGTNLDNNYVVGTIQARRGNPWSFNRLDVVQVNTQSAYNQTFGSVVSTNDIGVADVWKLKTCRYNGKKYMALEVPYHDALHDHGYNFTGWGNSSAEFLKIVNYQQQGQSINTNLISDIQDFNPNMNETHFANSISLMANVGIGTRFPKEKLSVNGKIRAHEIKVETANWPDYVFAKDYQLTGLEALEKYIQANKHLPEMPSAKEVEQNGIALGDMVKLQQKKIEELTLHLIEQNRKIENLEKVIKKNNKL